MLECMEFSFKQNQYKIAEKHSLTGPITGIKKGEQFIFSVKNSGLILGPF